MENPISSTIFSGASAGGRGLLICPCNQSGLSISIPGYKKKKNQRNTSVYRTGEHLCLLLALIFAVFTTSSNAQIPRLLLLEHFTGASCASCPRGNEYIDSLVNSNPGKIMALKYQVNIPSYDPMYNDDSAQIHQRMGYYGVYSAPTTELAGKTLWYEYLNQAKIDSLYAIKVHFRLNLQHSFSSGLDSMTIRLIVSSDSVQNFQAGKLHARIAVIEDSIYFLSPPGSNGEKLFRTVCKKMVPDPSGIVLRDSWSVNTTDTLVLKVAIPDYYYNLSALRVVAFVQDDASKAVLQSVITNNQPLPSYCVLDPRLSLNFPNVQCVDVLKDAQVYLHNLGADTLHEASLIRLIDGIASADTMKWTGMILPGKMLPVKINPIPLAHGNHVITVKIIKPNGRHMVFSRLTSVTSDIAIEKIPVAPVVHEYFTNPAWPYTGWSVYNPAKDGNTWKRIAYKMDNSDYLLPALQLRQFTISEGTFNEVYLPLMDASKMNSMKFGIQVAWCNNGDSTISHDTLSVDVTKDCGITWKNVLKKWGDPLAFQSCGQFEYIGNLPDTSRWKSFTADLSQFSGSSSMMIKIRATRSFSSNNMYLRNIFVGPDLGTGPFPESNLIRLYPNPVANVLRFDFQHGNEFSGKVSIINSTGALMYSGICTADAGNGYSSWVDVTGLPDGLYVVLFERDGKIASLKFIKAD